MATLKEQIADAVTRDDARKAGRIAEALRGDGWRYSNIAKLFNDASGIDAADFDLLMYEADTLAALD